MKLNQLDAKSSSKGKCPEQELTLLFAKSLRWAILPSLWFMVGSFLLYLVQFPQVYSPLKQMVANLAQSSNELARQLPNWADWHWVGYHFQVDLLSLTGLSLLSLSMVVPYCLLVFFFIRQGDWCYLSLCLFQLGLFVWASLA